MNESAVNNPILKENELTRAILAGVDTGEYDAEISMDELEELAETAGAVTVCRIIQKRPAIESATILGEGKIEELSAAAKDLDAQLIIFDMELSSSQIRNIEDITSVRVIDRTMLILDIFAGRAVTNEGKLQVELAQLKYRLPRLMGIGTSLSRLGGGIGTRGPGETQLETDRRHIRRRIDKLSDELKELEKRRDLSRRRRKKDSVCVGAIVGYTNAGKSTLLNALTGAGVLAEDKLFATLDTTTRLLTVSDTLDVVISDTVGFIRKLPHQLVEAFKATLEELEYADLLLHVIDISDPHWLEQAQIVDELIEELGAQQIPCLRVYNKSDLYFGDIRPHGEDSVNISAKTGEGVDELLARIDKLLDKGTRRVTIHLPYDKGGLLDMLYREAKVESVEYGESIDIVATCVPRVIGQVKDYIEGYREPKEDWEE